MEFKTLLYADVVVELPVPKELTYLVPETLASSIEVGSAVFVPLRTSTSRGYIISLYWKEPNTSIKPIAGIIEDMPPLPIELLNTAREVSKHYMYTWGDVLKTAIPKVTRRAIIRYKITSRGAKHLLSGKRNGPLEKVMDIIQENGELSAAQIKRRMKEEWETGLIGQLQRKGWVVGLRRQPLHAKKKGADSQTTSQSPARSDDGNFTFLQNLESAPLHRISEAWKKIWETVNSRGSQPLLLRTGSIEDRDKIYLMAADTLIRSGMSVIILKPEITAASQFIDQLKLRFKENVSVTHSGLSASHWKEQWGKTASGEATIVVGARSTIFAPVKQLGLIIVDEEHDDAYKQEEIPRCHSRDVALIRHLEAGCPLILGSTVPSIESFYSVSAGKMKYVDLGMAEAGEGTDIELVDLKSMRGKGTISPFLKNRIRETMQKGGQAFLYLNRLGYSTFMQCRDCGYSLRCPECEMSLIYHVQSNRVKCRFCRYEQPIVLICPKCRGNKVWYLGRGTQKVEEEIREVFPEASVCRLDGDTEKENKGLQTLVEGIINKDFQIVVGTKIALPYLKKSNFSLSAIIQADSMLNMPDFRAAEKCFRLVSQLAGALTDNKESNLVIQSFNTDHYSLSYAAKLDYEGFYREEIIKREELGYPPFAKMIAIRIEGGSDSDAASLALSVTERIKNNVPDGSDTIVMGPTTVHLARASRKIRRQILIKGKDELEITKLAAQTINKFSHRGKNRHRALVSVDVDPISFF